jgi:ribonuclease HI
MHQHEIQTTVQGALPYPSDTAPRGNPIADAYVAYADGSSLDNPGPAGWAYAIRRPDGGDLHGSGALRHASNNQAELYGAIQALLALNDISRGVDATLWLDSTYVVEAVNSGRSSWEANGWKTSKGRGVSNLGLLKVLFALCDAMPNVTLGWVAGHTGDPLNELVDRMARTEAEKARRGMLQ